MSNQRRLDLLNEQLAPLKEMDSKPITECTREELIERFEQTSKALMRAWERESKLLSTILEHERREAMEAQHERDRRARMRMLARFIETLPCAHCGEQADWLRDNKPTCEECREGIVDGLASVAYEDAAYGRD